MVGWSPGCPLQCPKSWQHDLFWGGHVEGIDLYEQECEVCECCESIYEVICSGRIGEQTDFHTLDIGMTISVVDEVEERGNERFNEAVESDDLPSFSRHFNKRAERLVEAGRLMDEREAGSVGEDTRRVGE